MSLRPVPRASRATLAAGLLALLPLTACGADADVAGDGELRVVTTVAPITSITAAVAAPITAAVFLLRLRWLAAQADMNHGIARRLGLVGTRQGEFHFRLYQNWGLYIRFLFYEPWGNIILINLFHL